MGFISICLTQQVRAESSDADISLFISLAEQGDVNAQWVLGFMYLNGEGIPQNYKQAAYWLTKAAEQGLALAQTNLGLMYAKGGEGVPQDHKKALEWLTKAAEQEFALAQFNLGFMYDSGKGVSQDDKKALDWYKKAALKGLAEAQTNLGVMYAADHSTVQDYAIAYSWFNLAALQGNELGRKNRNLVLKNMSSSQIKEGQILSTALYEKIDNQAR
jgi:TPR repeat protein